MDAAERRKYTNKNSLFAHWQAKGYDYIFNRFSWNVADNIFDSGDGLDLCWACGRAGSTEMAHITPRSQGGSDEMDNLFVLCSRCHLDAPDTMHPEFFDLFCSGQSAHSEVIIMALLDVSRRYEISGIDVEKAILAINARASSSAIPHHGRYSTPTITAVVESVLREMCCKSAVTG